jgi:hypothetical protein
VSVHLDGQETKHSNRLNEKESVSFRFHKHIMEELREEAEEKNESLNVLISKILWSYIKWYKPSHKAGNMHISKDLLAKIFHILTDEQLDDIAREHVKDEFKEVILMMAGEYTFASVLDILCTWFDLSGFNYLHQKAENNRTHIISVRFEMGRKWSIFMKDVIQYICEDLKVKNLGCTITSNGITFKVRTYE